MTEPKHETLFDAAPPAVRERLVRIQAEVEHRVPDAERCISYRMPAFKKGAVFFYFAAFKAHIGVYPPVDGPPELLARLAAYRGSKGNLSFPHEAPLPLDLIGDVAQRLAGQYGR